MSEIPEVIELGAEEEARRLWAGALEAHQQARTGERLVAICESVDLGLRAAEILVAHKLQAVRDSFPATIALFLETPDPRVEPHRDAIQVPGTLDFTAALDLLSEEGLECVAQGMHRGWEDRGFACERSRHTAQDALGVTLTGAQRDRLLLLAAYRNRIFRCPPPIRVVPSEILTAFATLEELMESLL